MDEEIEEEFIDQGGKLTTEETRAIIDKME